MPNGPTPLSCDDPGGWLEQNGVTIHATVLPAAEDALKAALAEVAAEVATTGAPFCRSAVIHYARFVFIPEMADPAGGTAPAALMYLADFDGPVGDHLDEIADIAAGVFNRIGVFLEEPIPVTQSGRRAWLADHVIADQTYYVNTIGRTVRQIRCEQRLREAVEAFLDRLDTAGLEANAIREKIRDHLKASPELQWALTPPPSDAGWRKRRTIARVFGIAIAIPLAIVLLPVIVVWALILRWHEMTDPDDPSVASPEHIAELAETEDITLQNQFSALGFVKPGWFRRVTSLVILRVGRFGARYFFGHEDLAGVKTIHFARWTFIDDRRRMLFASNYDGSLENYMGDFIDIVAWGLNAIFSNGHGYPKTRWLILDGAWREGDFKAHIRRRQIPTQVWYAAYPNLSAINIADNARLRAGLTGELSERATTDWLKLLRRNWGRPQPKPVDLDCADMQGLVVRGHSQHKSACYLLLAFGDGREERSAARRWLDTLKVSNGTSSRAETYVHIAFTHNGLRRLGCPQSVLDGFSNEFRFGMTTAHRSRVLGDTGASDPAAWDWGGPSVPVDAVLMIYARDDTALADQVDALQLDLFSGAVRVLDALETTWLPGGKEHFGFSDGISTPPMEGLSKASGDDSAIKPGEFVLGYENEYGRITPRPLVDPRLDPYERLPEDIEGSGKRDLGRNGTYLVFRQMSQDVPRFWQSVEEAANANGTNDPVKLAAKMVGRWPGGAPLTLAPDRDDPDFARATRFLYHGKDREGRGCPLGAHIRRTNPRDALEPQPGTADSLAVNKRHQLLRRGRTYGAPIVETMDPADILASDADDGERGLHFICLCANIARQFEFVQGSWVNNPQFDGLVDDVDPLIGRRGRFTGEANADPRATFTMPEGGSRRRIHDLPDFVTIRGGAYFFLPGIRALKFIANCPLEER